MVTPPRPPPPSSAVDQWTETDQEIIESLLLVESSARHPATHTPHASPPPHETRPRTVQQQRQPPPTDTSSYALPPTNVRAPTLVPVAYWVPTPPTQTFYAHPYPPVRPAFFAPASIPRVSPVDMELQEMLSEEERKAKHREVQRRFVQRKKEQMDRIRREAAQLEKRHSFLRLRVEQLSLETENSELQDQIDDADDVRIPTAHEINLVLEEECRAAQASYEPLTELAFSDLLRETMESVGETVIKDARRLDDRTKVQVMGWTGRRVLEPAARGDKAAMRFEISKQFTRVTPDAIVDRAWAEISSPQGYQRFFGSTSLMKIVLLQHVNNDAVVIFKTIFNPRTAAIQHSVDLVCRIRTTDETLIISRDLHVQAVRDAIHDSNGWCRSLNVLGFAAPKALPASTNANVPGQTTVVGTTAATPTAPRTDATAFRYNCCIQGTSEANLRYWLMEILFVLIRFETMLVAPLFTLAAP